MKQIITSLDIGTSTIKLVVGEIYNDKLNVLACSEVKSKGVKKGLIVNPEEVYGKIEEVFKRCEEILEIKINDVILCVPSYYADFEIVEGYTTINRESSIVNGNDIVRALQASIYNKIPPNKELISIMPIEYRIDDEEVVKDPKNLKASKLTVKSVISIAPKKNVYVIFSILDNMGIKISDICFNSLADYHEFKTNDMDEKQGSIINIGDEKTEVSIINNGTLIATQVLEMGGKDIDKEIMYAYNIDRKTAKKLKETFALAHTDNASTTELEEVINKDGEKVKINQYEITEIIYNKLKSMLEISKKQINLLTKKQNSYIIVTGGTTELKDICKNIEESFGRIGILGNISELGVRNNKYSSALGIIKYYYRKLSFRKKNASTVNEEEQQIIFNNRKKNKENTLLGKVFSYFFDN